MNGTLLRIYMRENRKQDHLLLYEWLLERARDLGVGGGCAVRALAGYGRHGKMREQKFYELAGDTPVVVEFAVTDGQADALLALVRQHGIDIFYVRAAVEFETLAATK